MLRQWIGSRGDEGAERLIDLLASSLAAAGLKAKQALPLIAPLLNLPVPKNYPPVPAARQEQRRQLLAVLSQWTIGIAKTQPAIMVLEDLHWADASTLELANLLADQSATAPLMLIYTARTGFAVPWPMRDHHAQLALDRLSERHAREMVESVASHKQLAAETVEIVVQRATGVPLFVEELTRDLLERGSMEGQIPATLHDSLMARLDRLGPARELAQIGATIGREFTYELLRMVAGVSELELQVALDTLMGADLLYLCRTEPEKSYIFKHALVQEAAYNTLLKSRRRELHQRIAQILQERFPEIATSAPELFARHYTGAGLIGQAVRYWRRAGTRATQRSANVESIAQLRKGLELLKTLPPTSERLVEEVRLQMAWTAPLIATKGYAAPQVEKACSRALELCQQVGEAPQLSAVLGGLNSIYFNRGELKIALELARQMLRLAEIRRDPVLLLWAHYALGFTLASQRVLKLARDHLQRSIALYDARRRGTYGFVQDPGATAMALLSHVVYRLGYPDQALKRIRQALSLARSLSHPFTLAWVLGFAGELYWKRGEKLAARELWEEKAALSTQQGFKPALESASFWLGFALVEQGRGEDGIAKMHDVYALYSSTDILPIVAKLHRLSLLALAQGKVGQADQGLARIDEALTLAMKTKEPENASALYRLYLCKGQLLLMKNAGRLRQARQCFGKAIEIAREQNAKSDELAAVIQLAPLLARQGHREQARAMLANIYGWFTEGFDTADLKDAKALLDELAG
jgi:tetratricopeptide (TPR) repeat protein